MVRVKANPKYMFKILTTLSAMVLLSIIMIMGFWAATIQTTTISSTISFTATDVDVNIVGVVTGSETPVATYTTNISDKEFDTVSKSWDLGQLLFSGTTKAPIVIGLAVRNNGIDTNPYITCEVVGDVPSNVKVRYSQIGGENAIPYSQVVSANEFSSALISSFQAESSQTAVGGISIPAYNPSSTNNLTTGKVFYYQIEFSIIDFNQAVDSFNLALGMTIQSNRLPERDSVYQVESKIDSSSPSEGGNCSYEVINSTSSSSTIKFVAEVEEGYEFDGWYIKDNSDNASDRISSDPVFITSTNADVTYYAKWKKARKVSFVVDGVNKGTTNYTSGTVSNFASAYEPTPYSTGWFLNEELTQVAKDDYLSTNTETTPVTLYCRTASITGLTFTLSSDGNSYLVAGESSTSPSGAVVIPNKYDGKPVSGFVTGTFSSPTFKKNTNITSVVLSNNISRIADYTFSNSTKITNVTIPDSVISIGSYAFDSCIGLTSIEIPNSVTSIAHCAFNGCSGLRNIEIPNSVTSIGSYAFNGCSGLTSIKIPDSVTTSIGSRAFRGCSGLTSIVVSSGNTKYDSRNNCNAIIETSSNTLIAGCMNTIIPNTVTSIGSGAFYGCSGLTNIEIPNSVTTIGESAFYGCSGLTGTLTIPNSVTSIGSSTFENCSGLTGDLIIPNSVTSIGSMAFYGCSGLTGIEIPNSVTSIGDYAFSDCSGLTGTLAIPDSVTSIGNSAFESCSGLTKIFIPKSVTTIDATSYYKGIFYDCSSNLVIYCEASSKPSGWGTYWNYRTKSAIHTTYWGQTIEDFTGLTFTLNSDGSSYSVKAKSTSITGKVIIPSNYEGKPVTNIGKQAFMSCTDLTGIEIPNSITSIGSSAFSGCTGLTGTLIIPNSVTSIENRAFKNCSGLTGTLTIPNSVTSIGYEAFLACSGLTRIIVSSGNTKYDSRNNCNAIIETSSNTLVQGCMNTIIPNTVTSIGSYAFYGCSGLTGTLTIPNSVKSIGNSAFYGCSGLTSVTIGNSVKSIGSTAFQNCSGLTGTLTIPNSVTSIGSGAFYHCSGLTGDLIIPNSVTSIEYQAFQDCSGLTNVTIGNSVTSIGNRAFQNCSGLTGTLTIPNSVTSIEEDVFRDCTGLTKIFIPSSVTTVNAFSYSSSPFFNCSSSLKIYCEASSKPSGWGTYWNYRTSSAIHTTYWGQTIEDCTGLTFTLNSDGSSYSVKAKDTSITGEVFIPSNYEGKPITIIGSFMGCRGLTSIEIPNSVTSIGISAFQNCSRLTSIEIPDSVTSIGAYAFYGCSGLSSIEIPDSVTSIGNRAFQGCTGLTKIFIPKSVTTINASSYSNSPFFKCSSSLKIYCEASSKPSNWGTYWNYYNNLYTCTTSWGYTREQFNAL